MHLPWYGPVSTPLNFFQSFGTFNERQLTKDIQAVPVLLARCEKWPARVYKMHLTKKCEGFAGYHTPQGNCIKVNTTLNSFFKKQDF